MIVQVKVAAIAVFILGVIWGIQSSARVSKCIMTDPTTGTIEAIEQIDGSNTQYRVQTEGQCTLLVTTARWASFAVGDIIKISGGIEATTSLSDEFAGYRVYLMQRGIDGTARFANVMAVQSNASPIYARITEFRAKAISTLSQPEAGVVIAMTLADRGMIPDAIIDLFRTTGLSHIIAISGLHMSILAGGLLLIGQILPLRSLTRTTTIVLILWMYVAVIGFPISATRAVWFWTLALYALEARALISLTSVFITTATLMISYQPQIILDIRFQLSFAAVAGIGIALFLLRGNTSRYKKVFQAIAVPIGATLATWPIISYTFGTISFGSIIANIFAIPAVPFFLIGALIAVSVSFVQPIMGYVVALFAHLFWQWIVFVARIVAEIPHAYVTYTIPVWAIVGWYILLIGGAIGIGTYQHRNWREIWE